MLRKFARHHEEGRSGTLIYPPAIETFFAASWQNGVSFSVNALCVPTPYLTLIVVMRGIFLSILSAEFLREVASLIKVSAM